MERPLGFVEFFTKFFHTHFYGSGQTVTMIRVNEQFDESLMKQALYCLYQKYPMLRMHFKEGINGNLSFVEMATPLKADNMPFIAMKKENEHQWKEIFHKKLQNIFKDDQLLWSLIALIDNNNKNSDLILNFHHSIMDGFSRVQFIKDLFFFYHSVSTNCVQPIKSLPLLPSVEELLKNYKKSKFYFFYNLIKESIVLNKIKPIYKYSPTPTSQRETKWQTEKLDKENLEKTIIYCKKNDIKITDLLNALLIQSIKTCLPTITINHRTNKKIIVLTSINCRRYFPSDVQTNLGCYVIPIPIVHEINFYDNIPKIAKEYHLKLKKEIEINLAMISNYKPNHFAKKILENLAKSKKDHTSIIAVSNLGNLQIDHFSIQEFYNTTSELTGSYIILLNALTINNILFLTFAYTHPLMSDELANQIKESFIGHLNDLIK